MKIISFSCEWTSKCSHVQRKTVPSFLLPLFDTPKYFVCCFRVHVAAFFLLRESQLGDGPLARRQLGRAVVPRRLPALQRLRRLAQAHRRRRRGRQGKDRRQEWIREFI